MNDAIVISDIHLGARNCQSEILLEFLDKVKANKLIIAGDLFDSFNVHLKKEEWQVLGKLKELSSSMEVIWVKGNHDAYNESRFMHDLIGAEFFPLHYIFESGNKKILIIHGDLFDSFLTDHPILTILADWVYWILQRVDRSNNIAKKVKHKSKQFLNCSEIIAKEAIIYSEKLKCDIACTGHTHLAVARQNYFNSGSWTELPASYLTVKDGVVELNYISCKT